MQFKSTDICLQNKTRLSFRDLARTTSRLRFKFQLFILTNQDKSLTFLLSTTCCLLKASWCSWDMLQNGLKCEFCRKQCNKTTTITPLLNFTFFHYCKIDLQVTSQEMLVWKECTRNERQRTNDNETKRASFAVLVSAIHFIFRYVKSGSCPHLLERPNNSDRFLEKHCVIFYESG